MLQAIERGSEAERFDGLLRARSDGVPLPEQTLKSLYETDASERVRAGSLRELSRTARRPRPTRCARRSRRRCTLPSAAIQREAKQRLDELHEIERLDALAVQGDP